MPRTRPSDRPAIEVRELTRRYGSTVAVDRVGFDVAPGSVFAFVGSNGAGKSTTIACLTTLLHPDAGEVRVLGRDVRTDADAVRARIGVVFQESLLDPLLTVRENLEVRGAFYRSVATRSRIDELSRLIGLEDVLGRRYGRISGGQRRRADIARALLASPDLIFLDEPTAGLDPAARALVWATIRELREQHGMTVFLTTHYMEETEEADEVCVIERGRVVAQGSPAELRERHTHSTLTITTRNPRGLSELAAASGCAISLGDRAEIVVPDAAVARRMLAAHGDDVLDFEFRHGTMDDVFLALTGRATAEAAA